MPSAEASHPLLAHFDGPEVAANDQESQVGPTRRVRGIAWVLKWAGILGMLLVSAGFLIEFGYRLAAEQALARAARAGILEATLPHATFDSVQQTIERRLAGCTSLKSKLQIGLQHNGTLVRGQVHLCEGDRLSLLLTVPSRSALPAWLARTFYRSDDAKIQAWVERRLPDRHLAIEKPKS